MSPGSKITGKNARYTSTITLAVTPPRADSGSPSKGTRPVRVSCPKAAHSIFLTLFPHLLSLTSYSISCSDGQRNVQTGQIPLPLSTVHSSDHLTHCQSSGVKCSYH